MPKINPLNEVMLQLMDDIQAQKPKPGTPLAVPFGKERLSNREFANRLFDMSPEQRKEAIKDMGTDEVMNLVRMSQEKDPSPPNMPKG